VGTIKTGVIKLLIAFDVLLPTIDFSKIPFSEIPKTISSAPFSWVNSIILLTIDFD
jgi:hypothetical protein